jgi:hypothetical protein
VLTDVGEIHAYLKQTLAFEIDPSAKDPFLAALKNLKIGADLTGDVAKALAQEKSLQDLLAAVNGLAESPAVNRPGQEAVRETIGHLREKIELVAARMGKADYGADIARRHYSFSIRPILRNPAHDLFLGDFSSCCLGMGSRSYPDAMVDRLIDEGINVIEVIDQSTGKTMAVAWIYIDEDGNLIVQNLEINAEYEVDPLLKDEIGRQMINYADEFSRFIAARGTLIGQPGHGKYSGAGGLVEREWGNRLTTLQKPIAKIGGYFGENYYLDSAGKTGAYQVRWSGSIDENTEGMAGALVASARTYADRRAAGKELNELLPLVNLELGKATRQNIFLRQPLSLDNWNRLLQSVEERMWTGWRGASFLEMQPFAEEVSRRWDHPSTISSGKETPNRPLTVVVRESELEQVAQLVARYGDRCPITLIADTRLRGKRMKIFKGKKLGFQFEPGLTNDKGDLNEKAFRSLLNRLAPTKVLENSIFVFSNNERFQSFDLKEPIGGLFEGIECLRLIDLLEPLETGVASFDLGRMLSLARVLSKNA